MRLLFIHKSKRVFNVVLISLIEEKDTKYKTLSVFIPTVHNFFLSYIRDFRRTKKLLLIFVAYLESWIYSFHNILELFFALERILMQVVFVIVSNKFKVEKSLLVFNYYIFGMIF